MNVLDALTTIDIRQLGVAQPAYRIVFIQALLRLGGGFDVPLHQRQSERGGDFLSQHGLAGTGFAFDEQGPLQCDGGIDREHQIGCGYVIAAACETHGNYPFVGRTEL